MPSPERALCRDDERRCPVGLWAWRGPLSPRRETSLPAGQPVVHKRLLLQAARRAVPTRLVLGSGGGGLLIVEAVDSATRRPPWWRPFRSLSAWLARFDGLTGDNPSDWSVAKLVAVWTVLLWFWVVFKEGPGGLYYDFLEAHAWSTGFPWSSPRHPPMIGWLTGLWHLVMPRGVISFLTAGTLMTGLTLWLFYVLYKDLLPPGKRVPALALTALAPMLASNGYYFNANTLQAPFWTLCTLFFLQSFKTRRALPSALAGAMAAGAVLSKYFAAALPLGMALATLVHPDRWRYWRSLAPYVSVLVFALLLVPHLLWVLDHRVTPFNTVGTIHTMPFPEAVVHAIKFVLMLVPAWALMPLLAFWLVVRPSREQAGQILLPKDPDHRLWIALLLAPILVGALVSAAMSQKIIDQWIYPCWSLLAPVLLASPALALTSAMRASLVVGMLAYAVLLAAMGPLLAVVKDRYQPENHHFTPLIAPLVEAEWERRFGTPLPYVGGDPRLAYGVAFYGSTDAYSFPWLDPDQAPWIDVEDVARRGMVVLCPVSDQGCIHQMDGLLAGSEGAHRMDLTARAHFLIRDHVSPLLRAGFVPPGSAPPIQAAAP